MTLADRNLADVPRLVEPASWDGVARGYLPPPVLEVDPAVRMHRTEDRDIDPVTYEVIRYALLNINLEHADLLQRLCVSPITMLCRDFQTSLMTQDGELVYLGPGIQFFANGAVLAVKWILEHRVDHQLAAGDVFLCNDPWVSQGHQSDIALVAPVMVHGEVFCWIANAMHHSDVGGGVPGSFCITASDTFQEPTSWPPIRMVRAGEACDDVEDLFARQSRFPDLCRMDLRAGLGGIGATARALGLLVERYGADKVKGVMGGLLDSGEQLMRQRLERIPDGSWSHRCLGESGSPDHPDVVQYQLTITKRGSTLYVDNAGTDPQTGVMNVAVSSLMGCTLAAIAQMVTELAGSYGGVYRCVEFRPTPGTMTAADRPAAVSSSGKFASHTLLHLASVTVSKMLACGDDITRELIVGTSPPMFYGPIFAGNDEVGRPFVFADADAQMGAMGGRPQRDGPDVAGHWWIPDALGYNCEEIEAAYPLVVLARPVNRAGRAGAGRQRGGLSFSELLMVYGSDTVEMALYENESFPKGQGLFGAEPASMGTYRVRRGTDARAQLAAGTVPTSIDAISGNESPVAFVGPPEPLSDGDVVWWLSPNATGFGDPLLRDPDAVRRDAANLHLDADEARHAYGVVLDAAGVDTVATAAERRGRRGRRLGRPAGEPLPPPEGARSVGDLLHVVEGRWWCNGADLGPVTENYKERCVVRITLMTELGREYPSPRPEVAAATEFREYLCPVTGLRLDTEIAKVGQPPLHDVALLEG